MEKEGQAALELILVLGVVLAVFLIILSTNNDIGTTASTQYKFTRARTTLDDIINAANLVYQQGEGAKTRVYVGMPGDVENATISGKSISIEFSSGDKVHRSAAFNLSGELSSKEGLLIVSVEAKNNYILINSTIPEEPSVCGNNIKESGEDCDGTDLGGLSCSSLGYTGGNLSCTAGCTFNTTQCYTIDTTPPGTITNLNSPAQGPTWIYWNWTNPADPDFNHTEVWLNGTFYANVSAPGSSYNATWLQSSTSYEIETRTADTSGNINTTWVNDTNKTAPAIPVLTMEWGVVSAGDSWTSISFTNSYVSPVVVASGRYNNNTLPFVVRMANVTSTGFIARIQNPNGSALNDENIDYLVVEEGNWTLPSGVKIEAHKYNSTVVDNYASWIGENQSYNNSYTTPVVLASVMSYNDAGWQAVTTWGSARTNPPDSSSLVISRHVGEDPNTTRANETVGFVVIEETNSNVGGVSFESRLGADTIMGVDNSPPYYYTFNSAFSTTPASGITTMAGLDGVNGGWSQMHGASPLSTTQIGLSIDEDQISDSERVHTTEQVSYLVFESTGSFMQDSSPPGTITNLNSPAQGPTWIYWNWTNPADPDFNHTEVWLNGTFYANVSAPGSSYNATWLQSSTSYEIETRTADNSGNINTTWVNDTNTTTRPYLAMEWNTVSSVTDSWTNINLINDYVSPIIVASGRYNNNTIPFIIRMANITGSNFSIRIENPSGSPLNPEIVDYLVLEEGNWTLPGGTKIEAHKYTSTVVDSSTSWVGEAQSYNNTYTSPVVLASVMSYNDPGWDAIAAWGSARTNPPDSSNLVISRHVGEDPNTTRADETVGFIVIEGADSTVSGIPFESRLGLDTIKGVSNAPPYYYTFNSAFSAAPSVGLTALAGLDGGNGGWSQMHGASPLSTTQIALSIDEDQVADSERSHTTEQVNYLVFESAGSIYQP